MKDDNIYNLNLKSILNIDKEIARTEKEVKKNARGHANLKMISVGFLGKKRFVNNFMFLLFSKLQRSLFSAEKFVLHNCVV